MSLDFIPSKSNKTERISNQRLAHTVIKFCSWRIIWTSALSFLILLPQYKVLWDDCKINKSVISLVMKHGLEHHNHIYTCLSITLFSACFPSHIPTAHLKKIRRKLRATTRTKHPHRQKAPRLNPQHFFCESTHKLMHHHPILELHFRKQEMWELWFKHWCPIDHKTSKP